MRLRERVPGERVITLGLSTFGYFGAAVVLRGQPLTVLQFDPWSATSVANAPFASEVAGPLRGYFVGDAHTRTIAFGVSRPVRTMRFSTPFTIDAFKIDQTEVRMLDTGDTGSIAETGPDPDEVIVSAVGKNDRRLRYIIAGGDALRTCSSIVFDKPKRQVRLSCMAR